MKHALDENVWEGSALIKNPRAGVKAKMKLVAVSVMAVILASGEDYEVQMPQFSAMEAEMSALLG